MRRDIAVSIIIPIYNAEKFLRRGLDSCVAQTMQNIEIICIDDASTDKSREIIKEYVDRFPDKVIQLNLAENSGQGGARTEGILKAKGEYLCFMDSDDYLDIHLCEEVYAEAKRQDADMVFFDFTRVEDYQEYQVELIGQEEINCWYQQIGCATWLQMIKREVILTHSLFLPSNTRADDDAITPLWRYYARKRCKIDKPYYFYVNRQGSLVNDTRESTITEIITKVISYRYQLMKQNDLVEKFRAESDWMIARDISTTLIRLMKLKCFSTPEEIMELRKKLCFSNNYELDDKVMRFNMSLAEMELVKTFINSPQTLKVEYFNYTYFTKIQIEKGMDRRIEVDLEHIMSLLRKKYGYGIAIWGKGAKGIPIISTLIRMGYDIPVFDNSNCGEEIWENTNIYTHAIGDLKREKIAVILVTSDFHYKTIKSQVHTQYPEIFVFNFLRMLRGRVSNYIESYE